MTKNNPGKFDCYDEAGGDEPIFVLRSTDSSAPDAVRHWAASYNLRKSMENAVGNGPVTLTEHQQEKFDEALECANAMERWRRRNRMKTRAIRLR